MNRVKQWSVGVLLLGMVWSGWLQAACTTGFINRWVEEDTPTSAFVLNSDGTATHQLTGLIWDRCALGQTWDSINSTCAGSIAPYTWEQAMQAVQNANNTNHLGHNDWRLPNRNELSSIIEGCGYFPSINRRVFVSFSSEIYSYWSSTSRILFPAHAWIVNFQLGDIDYFPKYHGLGVRLVRGGQASDSFDLLKTSSTTTLTNFLNPSVYGQQITLIAKVNGAGAVAPLGTVQFWENGAVVTCDAGDQRLNASGQASCLLDSLSVGTHPFTAVYTGDNNYNSSTSGRLNQVVLPGALTAINPVPTMSQWMLLLLGLMLVLVLRKWSAE